MKELLIEVRLKNNRLVERRRALGMSQSELALAAGLSLQVYGGLETFRTSPVNSSGRWSSPAQALANFHVIEPEELWPEGLRSVARARTEKAVSIGELDRLLARRENREDFGLPERSEVQRMCVRAHLTPREVEVVRKRFVDEETLEEIAGPLGVTYECVRQIEREALNRLRMAAGWVQDEERHSNGESRRA